MHQGHCWQCRMCIYLQTNRTTARIFPAVLDVENPEFKRKLDRMVEINQKIIAIGESDDIPLVKNLKRIPLVAALVSEIIAAYLMPPIESGSVDFAEFEPQLVYWFCRKIYPWIIFHERQVGAFSLRGFEWWNAGWLRGPASSCVRL